MLGRFSSAEVCCLNPVEGQKERRGENKKVRWREPTVGNAKKRVEERGVFSGIRLFLSVSQALRFSLIVMDGPPL